MPNTLMVAPEILERIKKLAAMADRGTEHEAALAAERMQSLLTEYNLTRTEVEASGEQKPEVAQRERTDEFRSAMHVYKRDLMRTIAENNFCLHLIERRGHGRGEYRSKLKTHVLIGRVENVQATLVMYDYIMTAMLRNCPYPKGSDKVLWLTGCVEMVCQRLREKRTGEEEKELSGNTPGLVRLADLYGTEAELNEDFRKGIEPGTTARRRREREAADAEYERKEAEFEKKRMKLVVGGMDSWDAWYVARGYDVPKKREANYVSRGSYRSSGGGYRGVSQKEQREYDRKNSAAFRAGKECGRVIGIGGALSQGKKALK